MSVLSDIAKSILFLKNDRLSKKDGGTVKGDVNFEGGLTQKGLNIIDEKTIKKYYTIQLELGGFVWSSGAEYANTDRVRTGAIKITPNKKIDVKNLSNFQIGGPTYLFYKVDGSFVSFTGDQQPTVPTNAEYMRIVYQNFAINKSIVNLLIEQI